ncbi:MAG: hypothetical protein V5B33_18850 [Candidatus Accumulibacter sp. UW20]|jgi:ElaB/YqjD/DUF883 family membrane-anchored ribosome-binding protein
MQTDSDHSSGNGSLPQDGVTVAGKLGREAEHLVKSTADYSAHKLELARDRLQETVAKAKHSIDHARTLVASKAEGAAAVTQGYVVENPWKALAMIGLVGIIAGMLVDRLLSPPAKRRGDERREND